MSFTDRTHPVNTDPVSIAEIAEFLRQLRSLSRRPTAVLDPDDVHPDPGAEQAAFLARKADLFARIAARHPDLDPATTFPSTPAQPDGDPA
jgi:hypothetical protein